MESENLARGNPQRESAGGASSITRLEDIREVAPAITLQNVRHHIGLCGELVAKLLEHPLLERSDLEPKLFLKLTLGPLMVLPRRNPGRLRPRIDLNHIRNGALGDPPPPRFLTIPD